MTSRPDDPNGVFEKPDTRPMTRMADHLRGLTVGDHSDDYRNATVKASADMMELQTDWLVAQHLMLENQQRLITQQSECIAEQVRMIDRLRGEG